MDSRHAFSSIIHPLTRASLVAALLFAADARAQESNGSGEILAPATPAVATPAPPSEGAQSALDSPAESGRPRLSADRKYQISSELIDVENELASLRGERSDERIVGPIIMVAIGYGTLLTATAVSLASFTGAEDIEHGTWPDDEERFDINDDGVVDGDDERVLRRVSRGFGVIAALGAGVGIGGTVLLARRLRERNAYNPEIRRLQRERRELRRQLDYAADVSPRGFSFSLRAAF